MLPLWPRVRKYWFLGDIDVGEDVGVSLSWLEVPDVDDRFEMLVTDSHHQQPNESPTQWFCHHRLKTVTIITLSPTSLSPIFVLPRMIQVLYFFFNRYFMRHLDNLEHLDWFPLSDHMILTLQSIAFMTNYFGNLIFETLVRIDVGLQKGTMLILLWLVCFLDLVFLYFVLFVQSK